jgi:hypothetical protein
MGCMKAEKKWLDKAKLNGFFMPIVFFVASFPLPFELAEKLPIHLSKVRKQHEDAIKALRDQYVSLYKRAKTE